MANKIHTSANGTPIDMQKLILQNEEVRAVGNMKVNARGDVIDSNNTKVAARNEQVNKQYRKQIGKTVSDVPVVSSKKAAKKMAAEVKPVVEEPVQKITGFDEEVVAEVKEAAPAGGLAGAIAKAREVKQEPVKTQREVARSQTGVKKI